jgi:hypothetical protein
VIASHCELAEGSHFKQTMEAHSEREALEVNVVSSVPNAPCPSTRLCVHPLAATAATNASSHQADILRAQEWLGHASFSTMRLYERRNNATIDSPPVVRC